MISCNSCPKISVIIPVYNSESTLSYCVGSILHQTYRNIEVILVNDGSKDSSLEVCRSLAAKDPRIKIIDQQNSGPNSARNKGIDASSSDFLVFVDSDDEFYSQDTLELNLRLLLDNPEADIVSFPQYREFRDKDSNEIELRKKEAQFVRQILTDKRQIFTNWFNGKLIDGHYPGKIFRKSLFDGWKLIEEIRFTEDHYDIPTICRRCRQVLISGVGGYVYKYNESSLIHSEYTEEKRRGQFFSEANIYRYLLELGNVGEYLDFFYNRILENGYYLIKTSYDQDVMLQTQSIRRRYTIGDKSLTKCLNVLTSIFGLYRGLRLAKVLISTLKK